MKKTAARCIKAAVFYCLQVVSTLHIQCAINNQPEYCSIGRKFLHARV